MLDRDLLLTLFSSILWALLGLLLFALAFWVMGKVTPFSLRKEIEEDQNVALAIIMASVVIGISIIIMAAIH